MHTRVRISSSGYVTRRYSGDTYKPCSDILRLSCMAGQGNIGSHAQGVYQLRGRASCIHWNAYGIAKATPSTDTSPPRLCP
jgi:hypothetical protein